MLQLEEPIVVVKWSRYSCRIDRGNTGQHSFNYLGDVGSSQTMVWLPLLLRLVFFCTPDTLS